MNPSVPEVSLPEHNPPADDDMTSLAVLPLRKTLTDLMEEDLYLAPAGTGAGATAFATSNPQSAFSLNPLPNLLNIPDSFVDHFNKTNGSSNSLNLTPSLFPDTSSTYDLYNDDLAPLKLNPFNAYSSNDGQSGKNASLQHPMSAYIQPELVQVRPAMRNNGRRNRFTTIEDHEPAKQSKDDDFYLFDTNIQPSQLMDNKNYFNPEDTLDGSLFIMNSDLDPLPSINGTAPVPGFEADYLDMDVLAEDAEAWSEDSDDDNDNYFQDDNNDFDDFMMNYEQQPERPLSSPQSFMKVMPPESDASEEYLEQVERSVSIDSMDMQLDNKDTPMLNDDLVYEELEVPQPYRRESETPATKMHFTEEYHRTAAEISATNPNHRCDLLNPSTNKPCNKQFSRPYDLIRHQETIHASKKKIYRCVICEGRLNGGQGNGKLKTFSRGDALSRHIKVKHGLGGQEAVELINTAKENFEYLDM